MSAKRHVPLLLWLAGIIAAIVIVTQTRFSADMSAFLPRSPSPAQQILVDQMQSGAASRLLLIAIENAPEPALAALSKELGRQLRADSADFGAVNNGDAAANDFATMRDLFWRYRYALSPTVTPARFTADGLHAALENDLTLLSSNMGGLVKETLPGDPTGEILTLLNGLGTQNQPASRDGVWFSPDGKRALLLAQTRIPGFDIAHEETILAKIEATFAAAQKTVPEAAAARLLLSGPGVFAVHTKNEMKEDISRLSLIATVLVACILLLTYRSPRILVLAFVPVASGALAGIAAVSLGFGFVHGITLGFGVTLIGEAVDYAIYLFTQTAPGSSAHATLPRIWPMLQLGVLVSICGFSAMLFSSFTGFAQLGLFSITGLVVAVAVTRWVLPNLLVPGFGTTQPALLASVLLAAVTFAHRLRWLLALVLVGAILVLVFHRGSFWQDDLTSLSPIPASDQKLDQTLRADLTAPDVRYLLMTSAPDEQQALANSEKLASLLDTLRGQGLLSGYDAPSQYLPSAATQQTRLSALPAPEELRARMAQALQDTPFLPDTFEPFITDVAAAKTQPPLDRDAIAKTPLGAKLDALLIQRGSVWTALLSLRGVSDFAPVATRIAEAGPAGTMVVDLKLESNSLLETYRREAVLLSLIGSLVIVALLAIALRSPRRIAVVVAPLAAAVLITAAILTAGGHTLSIFNLVGLLLTVAVGSNYCIFVERQDWRDANAPRMLASLVLANACTIIGFGTLSFARLPVLHDIGLTVATGTVLSLVSAAILTVHRAPAPSEERRGDAH